MKKKIGNILPPPPIAVKSELSATAYNIKKLPIKNFAAFTLAEILLSLTVIGIVAAIALPSLLGNANERAWETQKKALYTRFSQALPLLPSLNGYGTLEGTLSSNSDDGKQHVDTDTAAETFVRDGLSKVMKIANICDSEHLTDCGLPDKIVQTNSGSTINLNDIKSVSKFNPRVLSALINGTGEAYEQLDTKAAAFETVNGENILVYYNPNCELDFKEGVNEWRFVQPKICANFIYDLNGKKGPNTVGKDIGFITAFYSTDPVVVAPNLYIKAYTEYMTYNEALTKCKELSEDMRLPNIDELSSLFYNNKLINIDIWHSFLSSTSSRVPNFIWVQDVHHGRRSWQRKDHNQETALCIKR